TTAAKSVTINVNKASTSTTLGSSPNPSAYGQSVTLTASGLPITATGTVTFTEGSTVLGTGSVSSGSATFPISSFGVGSHVITAVYSGASNYSGSTSSALSQTVNTAVLTVTAGSPSMTYGGTVPTITPSYSGFKNGDTQSALSGAPSCSTTAASGSPVGGG